GVLRDRGGTPRARRLLRDRGRRPEAPVASTRSEVRSVRRWLGAPRVRRVRRGRAGPDLASLLPAGGQAGVDAVPLRLAFRARPDGTHRGDGTARALERLAT